MRWRSFVGSKRDKRPDATPLKIAAACRRNSSSFALTRAAPTTNSSISGDDETTTDPAKVHTPPPAKYLLVSLFLYLFSLSVLIPVFPALIELSLPTTGSLSEGDKEVETTERYGTLQVIKSALDLVSLPVLGGLSDYLGRKRVMLFCLLLLVLQTVLVWPPTKDTVSFELGERECV